MAAERNILAQSTLALVAAVFAATAAIAALMMKKVVALALLSVIGLAGALVITGNPRLFCLCALLFVAPVDLAKRFMIFNPHMGGASAFTLDLTDFFILALLCFQIRDLIRRYRDRLRITPVTYIWGGMMALGLLSTMIADYRMSAGQEVFRMAKNLILFLVLINELARRRQFHHAFTVLMLGIILQACVGLLQYGTNMNFGLQALGESSMESSKEVARATYKGGAQVNRVGALIGHSNLLAAYLALFLPMGIALLFAKLSPWRRILCAAAVMLGQVVLVITLSRTGWIAFAVGLVFVLSLTMIHPALRLRYSLARIALIMAIAGTGLVFSGPILKRIYRSDPGALNVRFEYMSTAWRMIKDRPILGFGLNSYVFQMAPYTREGSPRRLLAKYGVNWPAVHNVYALTWVEQGTIGFALFVILHLYILRVGVRNLGIKDEVLCAIGAGCLSGFLALMVDGYASFFMRFPGPGRMWWINVAIIVALDRWRRLNEDRGATGIVAAGSEPVPAPARIE